jgi:hypothetical protein
MNVAASRPSGGTAAFAGGALGVICGILLGFIVTAIFLPPVQPEVNNLSIGLLGAARSVLIGTTVMFAGALGGGIGVAIGLITASRQNPIHLSRTSPAVEPGITFTNAKEKKP